MQGSGLPILLKDNWMAGAGDWTVNCGINGWPALPPEPQPPYLQSSKLMLIQQGEILLHVQFEHSKALSGLDHALPNFTRWGIWYLLVGFSVPDYERLFWSNGNCGYCLSFFSLFFAVEGHTTKHRHTFTMYRKDIFHNPSRWVLLMPISL